MYLVSVIPISRGTPLESLVYASPKKIAKGSVIHVPVRTTLTPAVVDDCRSAEEEKAQIKTLGYRMKVLKESHIDGATQVLPPHLMDAVRSLATWYAATPGSVLASLVPFPVLRTRPEAPANAEWTGEQHADAFILQTDPEERIALYKSIIREEFARKRSVLFILPSMQDIDLWNATIGRGIGDYTHVLHSGMSPTAFVKEWRTIVAADHPVLVLGTPQALAIPRPDVGTIILDRESSWGYKAPYRPFIDYRKAAEAFARAKKARLVLGDQFLRLETLWRAEQGEFLELVRPKYRVISGAKCSLVDLRDKEQPATGSATLCSPALVDLVRRTSEGAGHMVILGARKGYAPQTVCGDCGTVVLCSRCSSPVVLYVQGKGAHTDKENVFLCHRCGEKRSAAERCRECTSWRLMPLGIGLDRAEEILKAAVPAAKILRLDRDHAESHKDAKKIVDEFYRTPGSILLGTEMMVPYLSVPVSHAAILSVQSLLTIPDLTMEERAFRLITSLRAIARETFLLQSRDTSLPWYEWALQGNLLDWYRAELESRKAFNYPPYSVIVKLTIRGSKERVASLAEEIKGRFSDFSPIVFPGFVAKVRQEHRMHALLILPRAKWPHPEIQTLLRDLPTTVTVQVEPDSLI